MQRIWGSGRCRYKKSESEKTQREVQLRSRQVNSTVTKERMRAVSVHPLLSLIEQLITLGAFLSGQSDRIVISFGP